MRFLPFALTLLVAAMPGRAWGAGLWLSTNGVSPNELRVAIAASRDQTTIWTSLSFDSRATDVALVLPVPPGARVDFAPDAWFNALDAATAPRVYPSPTLMCADGSTPRYADEGCAAIAEVTGLTPSIPAVSVDLLDDLASVKAWATAHDMAPPASVAPNLEAFAASRFVAVRFIVPPPGSGATQTVRVVMPGAPARLLLSLFDPGDRSPIVTSYVIGGDQGLLVGTQPVSLDPRQLVADDCYSNNYLGLLYRTLASDGLSLVQASSHEVWASPVSFDASAQFGSIFDGYFLETVSVATGVDPETCAADARAAIESELALPVACASGAQGIVSGAPACVPPPEPSLLASLSCGAADDVAVALSGLVPASAWLTRQAMILRAPTNQDFPIAFTPPSYVEPIVYALAVDPGFCPSSDGTGGRATSSSSSSASASGCDGAADASGDACAGAADGVGALGDLGDCAFGRGPRRRSPWPLAFVLAALASPLRRRTRRARKPSEV